MTTNPQTTVHLAVCDTLSDWEVGFAIAHINKPLWHQFPGRFATSMVAASTAPITTMGGMRVLPDVTLDELRSQDSGMLILPGNDVFAEPAFAPYVAKAKEFLEAGKPVAAICGATGALALAGILDDRAHTSNAPEFLQATGYAGAEHYRNEPVVVDRGLITAGAAFPVEFAKAIFDELGVFTETTSASWYKLYGQQDPAGFFELMSA